MKKSLYITETRHSLVYKTLILLLFFLLPPAYQFFREWFYICFLGLSSLGQKCKMNMDRTAA